MRSVKATVDTGVADPVDEDATEGPSSEASTDADDESATPTGKADVEDRDDDEDARSSDGRSGGQEKTSRRRAGRAAFAPLRRVRLPRGAGTGTRQRIRAAVRGIAAVVLGAVLAAAGYAGWLLYQQHQTDIDSAQALDAAKQYAVILTSTDPNGVDKNFNDILNGATGEFKEQYTRAGSLLRKAMIDNKVATHGTVLESAVKSARPNRVEVLLFVEQSVTNSTTPQPGVEVNAITITMEKVGDRWLASKVVLPGQRR